MSFTPFKLGSGSSLTSAPTAVTGPNRTGGNSLVFGVPDDSLSAERLVTYGLIAAVAFLISRGRR